MRAKESNDAKVCRLSLLTKTSLIEEYQFVFPNGQDVKLSICKISGIDVEVGEYVLQGKHVIVEIVKDMQTFLQYFAVKKRMSTLKIGIHCVESILSQYDIIVCESSQRYCIYFEQFAQSIYSFTVNNKKDENILRKRLQRGYNVILSDLRQHHIILGSQWNASSLRIMSKPDRLLLKLPRSYKIIEKGYDYYQFISKDVDNPYLGDTIKINEALTQILSTSNIINHQTIKTLEKNTNIQLILHYSDCIYKLDKYHLTQMLSNPLYEQFLKDHYFLIKLYQHFKQTCKIHNLHPLIDLWKGLQKSTRNKSNTNCDHKVQQMKLQMDPQLRNIGNNGISQNSSLYEIAKKTYYNPLKMRKCERLQGNVITPKDITAKISKIQTSLKKGKCMFHFLHAKQALSNNLLFRALGHYRKALLYSKQQQRCIILCEIGSILINLSCYSQAQQKLRQSIRIRTNLYGKYSIKMLIPLQNLMNLYLRRQQQSQTNKIYQYSQQIKARHNYNTNFRLFPNIIPIFYSQTIFANYYLLDKSKSKNTKAIGKKEINKFMIQKYPFLQSIYSSCKNILQLNDIEEKEQKRFQKKKVKTEISKKTKTLQYFEQLKKRMQFGQLNNTFYLLRIIFCLCNQHKLTLIELQAISHLINQSKANNRKDYIRLIFIMSYYYQRYKQGEKAIEQIEFLINHQSFSQVQMIEKQQQSAQDTKPYCQQQIIQRRYLQLCKRTKSNSKLLQIYSTIGWFQHNKNSLLLYDAVIFLKDRKQFLLTIQACRTYLEYHQQNRNPKNKEIILIIVKQLLDYQLVHQAWKEINKIFIYCFDANFKKEVYHLIGKICVSANKEREYSLCIIVFQFLNESNSIIGLDRDTLILIWNAVTNSLIKLNYECKNDELLGLYEKIKAESIEKELLKKIEDISRRKQSWKNLLNILSTQKDNTFNSSKAFSLDQLMENSQLFKDNIKNCIEIGLFNELIDTKHANQFFNPRLSKYCSTIIQLSLQYGEQKGCNSQQAITLQCFLFLALQKQKIYQHLLLHIWFISLPRRVSQQKQQLIFGGRTLRQKKFDELLLQYFNQRSDEDMNQSALSKLAWFDKKNRQLQKLYKSFQRVKSNQTTLGDIEDFSILYNSYSTLDESQSLLLQYAKSKEDALMIEHTAQWQN